MNPRAVAISLRRPAGVTIRALAVRVNGRLVRTTSAGGRYAASVSLRSPRSAHVVVRVTITTESRLKIVAQRRYAACAGR